MRGMNSPMRYDPSWRLREVFRVPRVARSNGICRGVEIIAKPAVRCTGLPAVVENVLQPVQVNNAGKKYEVRFKITAPFVVFELLP